MTSLVNDLDRLETLTSPDARRLTQLLMDTGRRPNELCRLPWDCLTTGEDGKWVLVWTNFKSNRSDRHLPIHDSTAKSIQAQQVAVRERFPHTDTTVLLLFPRERANPDGLFQITPGMYAAQHKRWVRSFPETHCVTTESSDGAKAIERMAAFVDDANMPFDCDRITPYAYRHTYCQRHADQGTAPEVLRELLDHRSMETTQGYYEVRERRLRDAVNRVYSAQVTGRGEVHPWRVGGRHHPAQRPGQSVRQPRHGRRMRQVWLAALDWARQGSAGTTPAPNHCGRPSSTNTPSGTRSPRTRILLRDLTITSDSTIMTGGTARWG